MGLMVPKVTVNVIDVRGGTAQPVANVPLGIGVFASEMSHIGKWLTERYETAFAPVEESAQFARFGMLGPQRLLNAALTANLETPVIRTNMANFMKDCVMAEMIDRPRTVAQFTASSDVWGLIGTTGWLNPARLTMVQQPAAGFPPTSIVRGTAELVSTALACSDAYAILDGQLNIGAQMAINAIAAPMLPWGTGPSQVATEGALSAAGTYIKARLEGANTLLTGASATAEQLIKQRAAVDALGQGIDASDPMAVSISQAVGIGNLSSAINYRSMAQIAQDALPKLRNAIEMLTVAAFPLISVLLLVAGMKALPLFQGYLIMLLWTQLWAPLYAVVNFMMISGDRSPYTALVESYGAQSIPAMSLMAQLGASSQDTAGMLTLLVPAVAYALAKSGEVAMSSMASSMLAPATSAAQSSGAQLAQGNSSMGNISWGNVQEGNTSRGNYTASQVRAGSNIDLSSGTTTGDTGAKTNLGPFGSMTRDGQGGEVLNVPSSKTGSIGSGVKSTSLLGNEKSSDTGAQAQQERQAQVMQQLGSALRDTLSSDAQRGFTQSFAAAWEQRTSAENSRRHEAGQLIKAADALDKTAQAVEGVKMNTGAQAGAQVAAQLPGSPTTGAPATGGSAQGSPAATSGTNAPSATGSAPTAPAGGANAGQGAPTIPAPGTQASNVPPGMRGQTAPGSPQVDPNSPEARIPAVQRRAANNAPPSAGGAAAPTGVVASGQDPAALRAQAAEKRAAAARLLEGLPVKGGAHASAHAGGTVEAGTMISEAARRAAGGEATEADRQVLGAALQAARTMRYDSTDRSTQSKGARLEQALTDALNSSSGDTATAARYQRAGEQRRESHMNQVDSSRDMGYALADQARAMFPDKYTGPSGDYNLARDMHDAHPNILAAQDALDKGEAGRLADGHPSGAQLQKPASAESVYESGSTAVDVLSAKGDTAARAANGEGREMVAADGPNVPPTSVANPQGLPGAVNKQLADGQQEVQDKGQMTRAQGGLTAYAAQAFSDDRQNGAEPLKLALRTLAGGAGYDSPGETIRGLAPYLSSEGRDFFAGLPQQQLANGGLASMSAEQKSQAETHINAATEAYKAAQPKPETPPTGGVGA